MLTLLISVGVVVVLIVGIIVISSIRNSKVNKYGNQVVAQKEQELRDKREAEKLAEEQKKQETKPAEKKAEPKEEKKAPAKKEPAKETPVKENQDKDKSDEQIEKEAEKLVADVPVATEQEAEKLVEDIPDASEKAETPAPVAEEKKEEVKPVEKKPAKKEAAKKEAPAPVVEEKKEEVKPAPKKAAAKKETTPYVPPVFEGTKKSATKKADTAKKSAGKWMLIPESDGYYFGKLYASNGEMIMQTERYKGIAGLKSGIETIIKNVEKDNFDITVDKYGKANYKLFASNHSLLCIGEGYSSKDTAINTTNSVKNFVYAEQVVSEEPEVMETKEYTIAEDEKSENGKWIVVVDDGGYVHAELKANNGQVLLVTEQYKGMNSLKSGLESIKKNIASGNFSSKQDKNENYNFKLYAENKRLLGLGAGYSTSASCESAIYSVMKFNDSVVIYPGQEETAEEA